MKRYLCECDYHMTDGRVAFKAGKVYPTDSKHFPLHFVSEVSMGQPYHAMFADDMKGFRELDDDLPIPDEQYVNPMEQYTMLTSTDGTCGEWVLAVIVGALIIGSIIWALIW